MGGGGRGEPGPPANGAVTPPATKQTHTRTTHTHTLPLTYAAGVLALWDSTLDGPAALSLSLSREKHSSSRALHSAE